MFKHALSLPHQTLLVDGDTTTGEEDIQALEGGIIGCRVRPLLRGNLLINGHRLGIDHIDDSWILDGNVEPTKLRIVPDGIRGACNRYLGQFAASRGV